MNKIISLISNLFFYRETIRLKIQNYFFIQTVITILSVQCIQAQHINPKINSIPYRWKNVEISGGGFVTGIIFHPNEKGLCYCRTDMGGAYRRNAETMRWDPLLDWLTYEDVNLMGVESIALDPSNPDYLYLACGTYTNAATPNGAILRSDDRGKNFARTDVPFKMGGNEDGRGNGERLAVDPKNSNILYMGTRHAGLWKSTDRAVSWKRVEHFPDINENPPSDMKNQDSLRIWRYLNQGSGIIFIIFDTLSSSDMKGCPVIYAGVSLMNRDNLFRSTDSGKTWNAVPGQPVKYRPTDAVLASDGTMYITYGNRPGPSRMTDGAVWKFETKKNIWTEITPDKPNSESRPFGYAAVAVNANNPEILIVSSYHRYQTDNGEEIFYTLDGGNSWSQVFANGALLDPALAPYTAHTGIHWLFDIEIDPFDPDHAMFTTGYGGHETYNLKNAGLNKPTNWHVMSSGIEETVALDLLSPPKGAHLISAIGDYGGFVHWDLNISVPGGNFTNPHFGNTNGVACAEHNPDIVVRVGRATGNQTTNIGYSTDGGRSWQPADSSPHTEARLGHIAVSADGNTWVWAPDPIRGSYRLGGQPEFLPVYYTNDTGKTWAECNGIPPYTKVIADRVNPNKFYGINLFEGKLFISHNGGNKFIAYPLNLGDKLPDKRNYRGDSRGGQDRIYSTPGKEGELWIAAFDGLYYSSNSGLSFSSLDRVEQIHAFGFGKEAPGKNYPVIYLIGVVDGIRGIFCSEDKAQTWQRINDNKHQWGLLLHITGDPKKYGRVYVGTHGRGIIYGDRLE